MGNNIRSSSRPKALAPSIPMPPLADAMDAVHLSVEKVKVARPRVRDRAGKEVSLESWQALRDGNLLLEWALNLMVLNVSTRKYHRAVRLPDGDGRSRPFPGALWRCHARR